MYWPAFVFPPINLWSMPRYMRDITYCANKECPKARQCERAELIKSGSIASVSYFKPDATGRCEYFIKKYK